MGIRVADIATPSTKATPQYPAVRCGSSQGPVGPALAIELPEREQKMELVFR
jgi:hypothetical protein